MADYSRNSFRPTQGFTGVRLQQGRVQLDADWNEHVDIVNESIRQSTMDLIGPSGAPSLGGGFRVEAHNFLRFDGSGVHADTQSTELVSFEGNQPFSVQADVVARPQAQPSTIFSLFDMAGRVWVSLDLQTDGTLSANRGVGASPIRTAELDWSERRHIVLRYDGAELCIFVDGVCVANADSSEALEMTRVNPQHLSQVVSDEEPVIEGEDKVAPTVESRSTAASEARLALVLRVGGSIGEAVIVNGLDADVHAVRVWGISLDTGALKQSPVNASVDPNAMGLIADWALDDGFGTTVTDASPNGLNLELHTGTGNDLPQWVLHDITISPGQFYVAGVRCQNPRRIPLAVQPQFPDAAMPEKDGVYVVYLDTWERVVTADEDVALREIALGGADTAVRTQRVSQVRLLQISDDPGEPMDGDSRFATNAWTGLLQQIDAHGSLAARRASRVAAEPMENRLYRVEIHRTGSRFGAPNGADSPYAATTGQCISLDTLRLDSPGEPWSPDQWISVQCDGDAQLTRIVSTDEDTVVISPALKSLPEDAVQIEAIASFVWSENNASEISTVDQIGEAEVLLRRTPRGQQSALNKGDLIAISNAESRLNRTPMVLRRVASKGPNGRVLSVGEAIPTVLATQDGTIPLVHRWRVHPSNKAQTSPVSTDWTELEHGVEVRFEGTNGHPQGDAWLIPTRAQTRDVEWPRSPAGPIAQSPDEGGRRVAQLAILRVKEGGISVQDCRRLFRPLSATPEETKESSTSLNVPDDLRVGGNADVVGTLTAGLIRGHLASGLVDTPQVRDRAISSTKLGTGAVGLRQLHSQVGIVPAGFSILGESPHPPSGFSYTRQQISVSNHQPRWRPRLPLAGTNTGRVVCVAIEDAIFALLDNGEIWRSESGSGPWHLDAEMRPIRRDFGAAALNGRLHIVGGLTDKGKAIADHDIYDPAAREWTKGPSLPVPKGGVGLAVLDDVLFAVGGYQGWFLPTWARDFIGHITPDVLLAASRTTRTVHAFDAREDRWVVAYSMATSRSHMGISVLHDRLHVVGGLQRKPMGAPMPVSAHEAFLPDAGRWEMLMPLRTPVAYPGMVAIGGQLHLLGGMAMTGLQDEHHHYAPLSDSWKLGTPLPEPRRDMGVTEFYGELYTLGGITPTGPISAGASCNVSNTLYVHQKSDGGARKAHDGSDADMPDSVTGGNALLSADSLAPIAAMAASAAAVSAASLAMDPDHAALGTRGPPAIPGGAGSQIPALDSPPGEKSNILVPLLIGGVVLALIFVVCAGGLSMFPEAQKSVQRALPSLPLPFASALTAADTPEAPPDLTNCKDMPGAPATLDVGSFDPQYARGLDVSHFQRVVPWASVQRSGIVFAYAKATESTRYRDPTFANNWQSMKDCAILRGAYHFYHPKKDPFKQAQNFLSALQGSPGDIPPVIDIEKGLRRHTADCKKLLPNLVQFAQTVEQGTGMAPMIYASRAFWNEYLSCDDSPEGAAATAALAKYPLWVALYRDEVPQMFGGWTDYAFWQYTDQGVVGTQKLDLDRFQGTKETLKAWLKALKTNASVTPAQVAQSEAAAAAAAAGGLPAPSAVPGAVPSAAPATPPVPAASTPPAAPSAPSVPSLPSSGS